MVCPVFSYAELLISDGHEVSLAAASTAELFDLCAAASAVVVWFPETASEPPPRPAELAMVLRLRAW